jgi:hypothetical protein
VTRPALRAVDTPAPARVATLDADDADMFPLRTAAQVARIWGMGPDYVHRLADQGRIPYVLIPSGRGDDATESEGRRRRFRNDHLRTAVQSWTQST